MTLLSLAQDLRPLRADAMAAVDGMAEAARAETATGGALQALTYRAKLDEARDVVAGGGGTHPILEAEAAARGVDVSALASLVIATAESWAATTAAIEGKRIAAKLAIDAATSAAAIRSIVDNLAY